MNSFQVDLLALCCCGSFMNYELTFLEKFVKKQRFTLFYSTEVDLWNVLLVRMRAVCVLRIFLHWD